MQFVTFGIMCRRSLAVIDVWVREPSYATVYSVIHALPAALVSLAHDGPKVYADRFELLYRREASRPNEMWQARSYSA